LRRLLLLLILYHAGGFLKCLLILFISELVFIHIQLSRTFRFLRLLWLRLCSTTVVHNAWHLRDSGNLRRWLVVIILIILLISYSPFSFLVLLNDCPLLVLLSFSLALPHSILVMDLHLLLHLLHHLLHAHCLSFVFTMNLLFNLFLNIHIFHCTLNWNHFLEVVYCFPEFFKGVILNQFLAFINI